MSVYRLLISLGLALALCTSDATVAIEFSAEEQAFIAAHPAVVVGGEMDWPPMDFVEDGVYKGAAKDYLDEISAKTGIRFQMVTGYPWSELLQMLMSREIDMVPMIYWTEQRARDLHLTEPFITVRHYVFTQGQREELKSFDDMRGLTMAIPKGYAHNDYLQKNHPEINILEVSTVVEAMDAVIVGRADAFVENTASVAYYTETQNIIGLDPAFPVDFEVNHVHMGIRKDWPLLKGIVQKALDEISTENATRIIARWTGSEATAKTFLTQSVRFTPEEHDFLMQKRELVACINSNRMPLEEFKAGNHSGMTADYLRVISEQMMVTIRPLAAASWSELKTNMEAGRCDLSPLVLVTESAQPDWQLSAPYLDGRLALATGPDHPYLDSLADASNLSLAVVEGYADVAKLRHSYPQITFVEYPTLDAALRAVVSGETIGALDYLHVISTSINRDYQGELKISGNFPGESSGFSMGLYKPEPLLAATLFKTIKSLPESVHHNTYHKWIAVSIEKQADYTLLMRAAIVVAILAGLVALRLREVQRHREEVKIKNTELERMNAQLESQTDNALYMAYHDQLTGLSNRAKLKIDLDHAIKLATRTGINLAVLFLDLDRFKHVNDTLGHDIGDKLLKAVATRIGGLLRDSDMLCRIGGDEFIVILEAIGDDYSPRVVARRIIDALTEPFELGNNSVIIGTSIGISIFPDDSTDQSELIKYADSAMYSTKENGRNSYNYYRAELSAKAHRVATIETSLRKAIEGEEFYLVYQPIIDTRTRCVSKVEALLRWDHPTLGNIPPDEFIPIAEEFGLIVPIGEWVLKTACTDMKRFEADNFGLCSIAINVSSVEFRPGDLAQRFKNIIDESGVRNDQIDLEITEGYMLYRDEHCEEELQELRDMGHLICVDDFGTGYSSLSYMKRLPLNVIKIDRSFISNIPEDTDDMEISQAIIALSRNLGYETVAEGVETAEQFNFLLQQSCAFAQGYYFSKPVAADVLYSRIEEINERLRDDLNARRKPQPMAS